MIRKSEDLLEEMSVWNRQHIHSVDKGVYGIGNIRGRKGIPGSFLWSGDFFCPDFYEDKGEKKCVTD